MSDRIAFTGSMEAEGRRIRGSVKLVGARTFRNGEWVEVDPNALMKASAANTIARWDHDPAKVLGRVSNDTLTVTRTPEGIAFETADLPHTTYADDALELVRGGYAGGSSFEIEGLRSSVSTDPADGLRVRRYTSIKTLVDVSPVIDPAFASMAAAFNKESDVTEIIEEPVAPAPATPQPAPQATIPSRRSRRQRDGRGDRAVRPHPRDRLDRGRDGQHRRRAGGELSGVALDQYEAYAKVYDERKKADFDGRARIARMKALHDIRLGRIPKAPAAEQFASEDYKQAFGQYLRSGNSRLMEQFAQTVAGDGTQGGFTVPDGFLNRLTSASRRSAASPASPTRSRPARASRSAGRTSTTRRTARQSPPRASRPRRAARTSCSTASSSARSSTTRQARATPRSRSVLSLLQDSAFDIEASRRAQARPADRPQAGRPTSPTARARPSRSACSPSRPT
jgi:phage head maturation protease